MAGEEFDLIQWAVRGTLEAGKWSLEQVRDWIQKKTSTVNMPAEQQLEMPSTMYEIPPTGAVDPNWYVQLYMKRRDPDAYMLTLTKTADAVAANVRVTGYVRLGEPLRFIGNTEWPGEFPTMDPQTFVVLSPGLFGELTPMITIEWDGHDGVRREAEFPVPGRFGMWG